MRRYRELVHMVRAIRENNADEDNFEASYKADCVKEREVALNSLKRKRNSCGGTQRLGFDRGGLIKEITLFN